MSYLSIAHVLLFKRLTMDGAPCRETVIRTFAGFFWKPLSVNGGHPDREGDQYDSHA